MLKVKDILKEEKNVIVNGERTFMLIQQNYQTHFGKITTEEEKREILEREVKKTYLIKGVYENYLRITI